MLSGLKLFSAFLVCSCLFSNVLMKHMLIETYGRLRLFYATEKKYFSYFADDSEAETKNVKTSKPYYTVINYL